MVETADQCRRALTERLATTRQRSALHGQLTITVLLTLAVGFALGRVDTTTAWGFYGSLVVLAVLAGLGVRLTCRGIAAPYLRFADQLDGLALSQRHTALRDLPTDRTDEIGRMAAAVRELVIYRIRDQHDAGQLRRTLDDRVTRATQQAVQSLEKIAMRDPLTDLGNRRFLDDQLPRLIEASVASDTDLVCVMIDLDNFKPVNDTLGHATGDELLKLLAGLLQNACREDDLAIRLGGDEFTLFMPGADLNRAEQLTARVRRRFRERSAAAVGAFCDGESVRRRGFHDDRRLPRRPDIDGPGRPIPLSGQAPGPRSNLHPPRPQHRVIPRISGGLSPPAVLP